MRLGWLLLRYANARRSVFRRARRCEPRPVVCARSGMVCSRNAERIWQIGVLQVPLCARPVRQRVHQRVVPTALFTTSRLETHVGKWVSGGASMRVVEDPNEGGRMLQSAWVEAGV